MERERRPSGRRFHGSVAACSGQVAHQLAVGHRVAGAGAAVAEDAIAADAEGADDIAAVVEVDAKGAVARLGDGQPSRSEEHTSELQSLMRISYAVFCLKKKKKTHIQIKQTQQDST